MHFLRVTFTLPPEVARALDDAWRQHHNIDGTLCRNKSNYVADLIARNVREKEHGPRGRH
ncbi:MAG: hypothetical protein JOZ86_12540 [Candidatus Eremiobacteraeota bacterium]|nr:hypothetical protein [Candidatus Eremiobacteraeota bacterium]